MEQSGTLRAKSFLKCVKEMIRKRRKSKRKGLGFSWSTSLLHPEKHTSWKPMERSLNCWSPSPVSSWHDACKESKRPGVKKKKKRPVTELSEIQKSIERNWQDRTQESGSSRWGNNLGFLGDWEYFVFFEFGIWLQGCAHFMTTELVCTYDLCIFMLKKKKKPTNCYW